MVANSGRMFRHGMSPDGGVGVSRNSLQSHRRLYWGGFTALILLPNGDLLNFLTNGTPFVVWKQILAVVLATLSLPVLLRLRGHGSSRYWGVLVGLTVAMVVLAGISLIRGLSLHRVLYAVFAYAGFASGLLFVRSVVALGRITALFRLLVALGAFCSAGLLWDYFTPVFDFLPRAADAGFGEALHYEVVRRAAFLFGASTTIFPIVSLSILAAFVLLISDDSAGDRCLAVTTVLLAPAGLLVTGSRAQVLLGGLMVGGGGLLTLFYAKRRRYWVAAGLLALVACLAWERVDLLVGQEAILASRYADPFNARDEGNAWRYSRWAEGVTLTRQASIGEWMVGIGLGSSMGMVDDGFPTTTHYESSLFQAFSEGGVVAVAVRYGPVVLAMAIAVRWVLRRSKWSTLLLLWLLLYLLAVTIAPTAGAYHTQLALYIVVALTFELRSNGDVLGGMRTRFRAARDHA